MEQDRNDIVMNEPRQIAVVSGKGGTGKTVVASSIAALAASPKRKLMLVDADVDAPNLRVLFRGTSVCSFDEEAPPLAHIHAVKPLHMDRWENVCAFGAIKGHLVDPVRCVGCRVCEIAAPPGGVHFAARSAGKIIVEEVSFGHFIHGRLNPGESGFGGFVYKLRSRAEDLALTHAADLILIDSSPGIGCPVIASVSGCDHVLIVTEPTAAGRHDFERITALCLSLNLRIAVCINKADINPELADRIERYCRDRNLLFTGRIPFDGHVRSALDASATVPEMFPGTPAAAAIAAIARNLGIIEG
jgi:MinD superfamily P-loop ATPase